MKLDALACAQSAYSRRVCGMEPPKESRYQGDFDFMKVVNAATLPLNSSIESHRKAWAAFRALFEEEWINRG